MTVHLWMIKLAVFVAAWIGGTIVIVVEGVHL